MKTDLIITLYGKLYNRRHVPTGVLSPLRYIIRYLANYILPIYYSKSKPLESRKYSGDKKIIVSLTSFPARINNVWLVVESLRRQTLSPNHIILLLSKEQFPNEMLDMPQSLRCMMGELFEIRFVDNDYKSHKKYLYTFKEYRDDLVVLVDDDLLYPSNMIEELVKAHDSNPRSIICRYGRVIRYNENNRLMPYNKWFVNYECYSDNFFFGSGGGTLLEPRLLYEDVCNKDLFLELTPHADDIWLNAMARLSKLNIIPISKLLLLPVINKNNARLAQQNIYDNENDKQISNVVNYYSKFGLNPFALCDNCK